MPLTIALTAKTFRNITFTAAGRTAGYDQVQFQVSTRPDFSFALAPLYNLAPDGAGAVILQNLNQAQTYFVRARERRQSDGAVLAWTDTRAVYLPMNDVRSTAPLSLMVRPAILVVPEPVTWGAVGAEAGYPASNLNTDSPQEQLWATGWTQYIDFDTPGAPIDTIALLGSNVPAGMNWQVRAYNDATSRANNAIAPYETSAVQFHASPNLPGRESYHGLIRLPTPRSDVFWRIVFVDSSNGRPPTDKFVFTYGVVGLARTAKNIAADKSETPLDYGVLERTRDGIPDRRRGYRGRRVEFDIAMMTEAQWETQFSDLRSKIGLTDPVLVVPNMREGAFLHDRILYGPLASARSVQPHTPRFTQQLSIDSLI